MQIKTPQNLLCNELTIFVSLVLHEFDSQKINKNKRPLTIFFRVEHQAFLFLFIFFVLIKYIFFLFLGRLNNSSIYLFFNLTILKN